MNEYILSVSIEFVQILFHAEGRTAKRERGTKSYLNRAGKKIEIQLASVQVNFKLLPLNYYLPDRCTRFMPYQLN